MSDLVLLSTKNLKYQIIGKHTEKLIERFVRPYRIKAIIISKSQLERQKKKAL